MGMKTFNIDEEVYKEYSNHCKEHGISMSKRVEGFIKEEVKRIKAIAKLEFKTDLSEDHSFKKYC